jgi:hypothetical protein
LIRFIAEKPRSQTADDNGNARRISSNRRTFLNHLNEWPGDMQSLATFGQEQLNLLLQHFQDSLTRGGCDLDLIKTEWTDFKAYVYKHHTKRYKVNSLFPMTLETDSEMFL